MKQSDKAPFLMREVGLLFHSERIKKRPVRNFQELGILGAEVAPQMGGGITEVAIAIKGMEAKIILNEAENVYYGILKR